MESEESRSSSDESSSDEIIPESSDDNSQHSDKSLFEYPANVTMFPETYKMAGKLENVDGVTPTVQLQNNIQEFDDEIDIEVDADIKQILASVNSQIVESEVTPVSPNEQHPDTLQLIATWENEPLQFLTAERDNLAKENQEFQRENRMLREEKEKLKGEKRALEDENGTLTAEKDALQKELDITKRVLESYKKAQRNRSTNKENIPLSTPTPLSTKRKRQTVEEEWSDDETFEETANGAVKLADDFWVNKADLKKLVRAICMRHRCNMVLAALWDEDKRDNHFFKCPSGRHDAKKLELEDLEPLKRILAKIKTHKMIDESTIEIGWDDYVKDWVMKKLGSDGHKRKQMAERERDNSREG